jgi:hypothetical protein
MRSLVKTWNHSLIYHSPSLYVRSGPLLLRSVLLDALFYPNHTASLRPNPLNQISNQCAYLVLGIFKILLQQSACLGDLGAMTT